ncbi:MAG: molybdopterin cofactor-binding domain-containing protein, partial [Pseudomonadota bacterium]
TPRRARLSPWRGIGSAYTTFAAEAFLDEFAEVAGSDPVAMRMQLMRDNSRGQRILERALEKSDWARKRDGTGLGLAFGHYGGSQGVIVTEIAVDRDSGEIAVENVWGSFDGGLIISPDNSRAQLEGGVVYGISSALKERITISDGEVEQSNFYDYELLRANEVPPINIYLVEVDAPPTGMGELSTPIVAPAIANAFHALTGRRLRHMPFTPDRVLAALA